MYPSEKIMQDSYHQRSNSGCYETPNRHPPSMAYGMPQVPAQCYQSYPAPPAYCPNGFPPTLQVYSNPHSRRHSRQSSLNGVYYGNSQGLFQQQQQQQQQMQMQMQGSQMPAGSQSMTEPPYQFDDMPLCMSQSPGVMQHMNGHPGSCSLINQSSMNNSYEVKIHAYPHDIFLGVEGALECLCLMMGVRYSVNPLDPRENPPREVAKRLKLLSGGLLWGVFPITEFRGRVYVVLVATARLLAKFFGFYGKSDHGDYVADAVMELIRGWHDSQTMAVSQLKLIIRVVLRAARLSSGKTSTGTEEGRRTTSGQSEAGDDDSPPLSLAGLDAEVAKRLVNVRKYLEERPAYYGVMNTLINSWPHMYRPEEFNTAWVDPLIVAAVADDTFIDGVLHLSLPNIPAWQEFQHASHARVPNIIRNGTSNCCLSNVYETVLHCYKNTLGALISERHARLANLAASLAASPLAVTTIPRQQCKAGRSRTDGNILCAANANNTSNDQCTTASSQ